MPHIHLQTTADLAENANVPDLLTELAECLATLETIDSRSIKAYHSLRSIWQMGEGAPPGFAHCEVAILTGRPLELRKKMADSLYAILQTGFRESQATGEAGLTLELREMDRETYRKSP